MYKYGHLVDFLIMRVSDWKMLYANPKKCGTRADASPLVRHQTDCKTTDNEA
jgi:hypothetical protein